MAGHKGPREPRTVERVLLLRAVKTFHTFAWFSIEACMIYVLYAGLRGRTDRKVGMAAGVVTTETLIFAANGFHCPLTAVAEDLGDESGSVTDIYLPHWFARNLPGIHVPLIIAAALLHWRNFRAANRETGNLVHRNPAQDVVEPGHGGLLQPHRHAGFM